MASVIVTTDPATPWACKIVAGNHTIISDVTASLKGADTGMSPHEGILGEIGACTAMKVSVLVNKRKLAVTKVIVEVTEDKVDDPDDTGSPKKQIIRVKPKISVEGTVTDAELADLQAAGDACPMTAWAMAKKVFESSIERA